LRESFDGLTLDIKSVSQKIGKMGEAKKAMPFAQALKKRLDNGEKADAVFGRKLLFDELATLREMLPGLRQIVQKCRLIELVSVHEGGKSGDLIESDGRVGERMEQLPPVAESAVPGNPSFLFENV
jgi:leucyl-tRNA synthetase